MYCKACLDLTIHICGYITGFIHYNFVQSLLETCQGKSCIFIILGPERWSSDGTHRQG